LPNSGVTPSVSKNPAVTPAAPMRSGSPPCARSAARAFNAAILAKLAEWSRHSATSALAGGGKGEPGLRAGLSAQMTASRYGSGNGVDQSTAARNETEKCALSQ